MPKFTIITINYNNLLGLKKTFESVRSQIFTDFEWIIIDGGSTDGSRDFILQNKDNFSFWCSEPDNGVYNAMNKGISKARGEYVNFMNSGDTFYDQNTLLNVANEKLTADIVYGDWLRIYPNNEIFMAAPHEISLSFLHKNNICHQGMFIRREVHCKELYDERYSIYGDWALWRKLLLEGHSFCYIPYIICRFEAGVGLSETQTQKKREEREWIDQIYPQQIKTLLVDNSNLTNELKVIGHRYRTIFLISQKHPVFRKIIYLYCAPIFLLARFFYSKDFLKIKNYLQQES